MLSEGLHCLAYGAKRDEIGTVGAGARGGRLVAAGAGPLAHVRLAVLGVLARSFAGAQRKIGELRAEPLRRHASGTG